MSQKLSLIYIPGLGDHRIGGQQKAVSTWKLWGVKAQVNQMNWADGEPWPAKFSRLSKRIDDEVAQGYKVGLVAASAGASAAINAYAARRTDIVGVVLIAGKVNRPAEIGAGYRIKNPAFVTSAYDCTEALQTLNDAERQRILSLYAIADEVVYKPDSRVAGAHNRMVPSIGHFFTIATQLTLGAPFFIAFLKRQARNIK